MKRLKLFEEFTKIGPASDSEVNDTKLSFRDLIEWLQDIYEWSYVEQEGQNRIRFDWRNGDLSFWLNDDMTGEGELPASIKRQVLDKGVKIGINEGLGVLGVLSVLFLSWLGLKKLVKFLTNKFLRTLIGGTITGLQQVKIQRKNDFEKEVKVLELNDRYRISIPDGLILSAPGSDKKLTIRDILLFKKSKRISVVADGFRDLTTILTDKEYANVIDLLSEAKPTAE